MWHSQLMRKTARQDRGQGLLEYALIIVFVAIVVFGALLLVGPTLSSIFQKRQLRPLARILH
jgi:Flp pilus assembly pilin Flp